MKKKTLNSILAAGAMVILSIGVIAATNIFTGEKQAKQNTLDVSAYTSDEAEVQAAAELLGDSDEVTGYVVTVSSVGFNAETPIVLDVTLDASGTTVTDLSVVSHAETTGLGANIETEEFQAEFAGIQAPVYTADMTAEGSAFDQITGATLSSKAVAAAVNTAYDFVGTIAQ